MILSLIILSITNVILLVIIVRSLKWMIRVLEIIVGNQKTMYENYIEQKKPHV